MKLVYFLLLLLTGLPSFAQKTCQCEQLKETIHSKTSDFTLNGEPFTGTCTSNSGSLKVQHTLVNGLYEGETKAWTKSGVLIETMQYKAGKMHGAYKSYYETSGKLKVTGTWTDGHHDGKWTAYYENGKISCVTNNKVTMDGGYSNGWRDGAYLEYYENGQPKVQGAYTYGEETGTWTDWYANGKKKSEKFYKTGLDAQKSFRQWKIDTWNYWDESGKLIKTEKWADGKLAETVEY